MRPLSNKGNNNDKIIDKRNSETYEESELEDIQKLIDDQMRAVVLGTSAIINNKVLPQQGNRDFMLNCVNWLVGQEEQISIRAKGFGIKYLSLTPDAGRLIFYSTVFLIPLLVFAVGIVIYLRRRHL